jgi:hypothetical protein
MELSGDELAGVVDLFGGLTRAELARACSELAYRAEGDADAADFDVEAAERSYRLVAVETGGEEVLVAGPTAFPTLPEGASDLPHMLDAERRDVPETAALDAAEGRLRADAARAVDAGDDERVAELLDTTYDVEAWVGGADLSGVRELLER